MITPSDIPELLKPGRTILLPGRILVSPHGKLIQKKKKTAILSSCPTEKYIGVPVYFIEGNKALGIIEIEKPRKIDLKDFENLKKFHQVSDEERKRWWKDKEFLYYYPIKLISCFEPSKEIERPKGAQVWLKAVTFKSLEMFNPNEMTDEELFETHSKLTTLWKEKVASKEELINYNLLVLNEIKNRKLNFPEETELDRESKKFQEEFSKAGFKITFFGTKGLVEEEGPRHRFHTSILYEFKGKKLLVDYGEKNQGKLSEIKPDFVLVSHSHPDHIGGLDDSQCIVSKDTAKEIPELYKDFNIDVRTQYKSYQTFELGPFKITPIPVLHSVRAKMHVFLIEMGDKRVLQATDILSWHSDDKEKYVKDLDLAIIDGSSFSKTLARRNVKYDEPFGHSSIINQLKNWYIKDKVKRIIITHLGKESLSMGDEELLKKCKEITEVPVAIAKDNVIINLSEGTAPIYTSGKVLGRRIHLKDVLPYFKDFMIQRPLAYLTGGLVNQGSTKGDIDILLPSWLSFDMRRIIEFRIARSFPWHLRRRLHFVYDVFSTPFTHAIPLYNMVMLRSKDKMIKLSEIEKQLREKPRDVGAIKDAEASAKEDRVELFRYFLPLKPTRGYYPEKRQTIDLFIEVMENMGSYPFYSEKKYDGINGEFHYDGKDKVIIFSEDGDEITESLPAFVEQIKKLANKPVILVGEIEHWHDGKHMPRESCNGLIHRKIGASDEELVVNVYDIVYYGKDIHNLPFEERLKILDSLPFKQKTFYPPNIKIKFNETPHLLSKNREELKKHTEFLRKLEGSEGNVCKTKDFKYNLKGIRSGSVKFHNSTVVYGKVLQVKETKVKGVYNYYFGLEKGGIKAKVEELENTFYHRVGRSFSTNIKAKIGEVLEIEGETLNAEHNLKEDFWRLSLWAPRVMGKVDRKADTIKEAIERAKKNYCFQEKEVTDEGKIIYKILPAFGSVGGKRFLAKKIVQYFSEHQTYVEPFCGGASVFFAKKSSEQEVLNDRNPEIAFALRFIRDITPEKINRLKKFDWVKRRETFEKLKKLQPKNDFARFYKFFYTRLASYGNDVVTGFSPAKEGKEIQFENTLKRTTPRLKGVKIFNKDYEEIVKKFDSRGTLFFFDPPYPAHWDRWHSNRTHEKKFDEKRFEKVLRNLKGKFIFSYETEGAKQFSDFYQMRIEAPARLDWKDKREKRYELLISNFPLKKTSIYLSGEVEKLHLKEFRITGVDEDLKNPKEREKELIADLRYLANAGFPRLKAGKKWGEWRMVDILKYFAKIVDTLHSIRVNIRPKKKSGSWYECWKRAERYMKTQIKKQGDPYMDYPGERKKWKYVVQHHFRGRTCHSDLRIEHDSYLIGWTLMDEEKEKITQPVLTLKEAKEFNQKDIWKIDWKKGVPKLRPGIKPGFKKKYAEIAAARKSPEPKEWVDVEGITPKGQVGATKEYPGVFAIIDKGFCEYGMQKSYAHEYFFSGGILKGRWFFRQLRSSEFKGKVTKEEVIPPSRETQFRQEAPWFFIKPLDETPYVISKAAVKKKWISPKGVSALPEKIRKKIPKEFQYWKFENEKKRIEIRNALVEKFGKTLIEKKLNPGALWAKAAYRYVLSKQILNLWLKTPYSEKVERVRSTLKEFKQLEPFKKEWLSDAIAWLELRPTEMKRLIVQELKAEKSREVRWVLQHHFWRGQKVIRAGASVEHWDLRIDFPERENLMHFVLEQNPLRNKEVTAIFKLCKYKEWINFSGYIPPANERAKMTKEELEKFPPGIEEANPTKATSSYMEILDKGKATVYEDSDLFKKFEFGGKKLKGLWVFIREDNSKFWTMKKSSLPKTEKILRVHKNCLNFKNGFCVLKKKKVSPDGPACPLFKPK